MSIVSHGHCVFSIKVRGKLGRPDIDDPTGIAGIYQVRRKKGQFIQVKEVFYRPYNPQSDAQTEQRNKLTNAVVAWQALSDYEKSKYNKLAKSYKLSGYNLYLSRYMKAI